MKVSDIIAVIEKTAPLAAAASWDAPGVQVAALTKTAKSVAVVLDPTLESLRAAADLGADFVLAHHPLSMRPRFPNRCDEYLAVLSLLCSRTMWLYSAHTSLDGNPAGPVRWLAEALGMRSLALLEPAEAPGSAAGPYGFGFSGVLGEAMSYQDFCVFLAAALGEKEWQVCGPRPDAVFRVACCPGSGNSLLAPAVAAGADVFITGDMKYHAALEARAMGLRVLDVGHFVLEEEMMRRFARQLEGELSLPVVFIPGRDPLQGERVSSLSTAE